MPLHLLGKKSWNVYNTASIDKVRRDEAAARALEEAEEQRMQDVDAERRMKILRGEEPTPLAIEDVPQDPSTSKCKLSERGEPGHGDRRDRKRRKKAGENDTEFEMRVAHQDRQAADAISKALVLKRVDAPLVDHKGHIDLFPQEQKFCSEVEKNAEAERELAKKKKEYEDQYTMKFSNAAGFKQRLEHPWWAKKEVDGEIEVPGKDVWGNEDPRRKERALARMVSNDPFAAMKAGAAQARQVARERKAWTEDKEKELQELRVADARRRRRKRRHEEDDEDNLEDFRLDGPERGSSRRENRDPDRQRRHRHGESRRSSHKEREEGRHRHRHRHD